MLAGTAGATTKPADGVVEMIREVKVARDSARKARTVALLGLQALLINAPAPTRESHAELSSSELIARCAGFRLASVDTPGASLKFALRVLARCGVFLDEEMSEQRAILDDLTKRASLPAPGLLHRHRLRGRTADRAATTPSASLVRRPWPRCAVSHHRRGHRA